MTAVPHSTGGLLFVMEQEHQSVNIPVYNSPMGYMIPYKFFLAYVEKCAQQISDTQDIATESIVSLQQAIKDYTESDEYNRSQYLKSCRKMGEDKILWQVALVISAIIIAALSLALLIVLI